MPDSILQACFKYILEVGNKKIQNWLTALYSFVNFDNFFFNNMFLNNFYILLMGIFLTECRILTHTTIRRMHTVCEKT